MHFLFLRLRFVLTVNLCVQAYGLAVAQAVSCRLPTTASLVRARAKSCGICGGKSGTGAGFLRILPSPLPLIHSTNYSTNLTIYHPVLVQ
jgi:hypothetical protein